MSIRKTVVAGSFYPNEKDELLSLINSFSTLEKNTIKNDFEYINSLIVPHAGFIYSGELSNISYSLCSNQNPKRIIVIGPSHDTLFDGSHICLNTEYETPLGNIKVDLEFSKALKNKYSFFNTNEECEFEHSTETQAPFIKYYFPSAKIVEIIYGNQNVNELVELIDQIIEDEENLLVISTDLSHFHSLEKAKELDIFCMTAIDQKDISILNLSEACGKIGIEAILNVAIKKSLKTKVLKYTTSYDTNHDKSNVVGYTTALIGK